MMRSSFPKPLRLSVTAFAPAINEQGIRSGLPSPRGLSVGESAPGDGSEYGLEASVVPEAALVEREDALVEVAEEVVRLDADVGAVEAALDEAPEVLDAVRVYATIDIAFGVVDRAVREPDAEPVVRRERVGVDHRAIRDGVLDTGAQCRGLRVRDDLGLDLAAAFDHPEHGGLMLRPAPRDAPAFPHCLVHVAGLPPDVRLVDLDLAG